MIVCPREKEILALLSSGQWPGAAEDALRGHAETCARCADLLLVKQAFVTAREQSLPLAPLGAPGLLWWRAQLRRRYVAVERIGKPITRAQVFALALYCAVAAGLIAFLMRNGFDLPGWLASLKQEPLPQTEAAHSADFWASLVANHSWNPTLLVPALAALALLSGVAIYLALDSRFDKS